MIVGINYNLDGSRYISRISYNLSLTREANQHYASVIAEECEEVYIVAFDDNCQDFINEIVTKGCRMV